LLVRSGVKIYTEPLVRGLSWVRAEIVVNVGNVSYTQGLRKLVNFSSCKLFRVKMVVRMISGNHSHNHFHELRFTCFVRPLHTPPPPILRRFVLHPPTPSTCGSGCVRILGYRGNYLGESFLTMAN
jgi:hypothetical protein